MATGPSVNSVMILNYLKQNYNEEFSKQQIADALGISLSSVIGTMNSLIKKGHAITTREVEETVEPATETRKAKTKMIKFHTLTESGLSYDPVAEAEEKAAAKEAEKAAKKAAKEAEKAAKAAEQA